MVDRLSPTRAQSGLGSHILRATLLLLYRYYYTEYLFPVGQEESVQPSERMTHEIPFDPPIDIVPVPVLLQEGVVR